MKIWADETMSAQIGPFVVVILAGRFGLRFLFDTMVKLAHEAVFVYTKLKFRIASATPGPLLGLFSEKRLRC